MCTLRTTDSNFHASAGNRTRVTSMATMYSTTRPLMLLANARAGNVKPPSRAFLVKIYISSHVSAFQVLTYLWLRYFNVCCAAKSMTGRVTASRSCHE